MLINKPAKNEKITAVNKLGPKASLLGSTWNKFEHVNTESDATEHIVPAAHPTRCACMSNAGWISIFEEVSKESTSVLVITGWIPMKENAVMISGVSARSVHDGKNVESI